jgi:hypothetical protein
MKIVLSSIVVLLLVTNCLAQFSPTPQPTFYVNQIVGNDATGQAYNPYNPWATFQGAIDAAAALFATPGNTLTTVQFSFQDSGIYANLVNGIPVGFDFKGIPFVRVVGNYQQQATVIGPFTSKINETHYGETDILSLAVTFVSASQFPYPNPIAGPGIVDITSKTGTFYLQDNSFFTSVDIAQGPYSYMTQSSGEVLLSISPVDSYSLYNVYDEARVELNDMIVLLNDATKANNITLVKQTGDGRYHGTNVKFATEIGKPYSHSYILYESTTSTSRASQGRFNNIMINFSNDTVLLDNIVLAKGNNAYLEVFGGSSAGTDKAELILHETTGNSTVKVIGFVSDRAPVLNKDKLPRDNLAYSILTAEGEFYLSGAFKHDGAEYQNTRIVKTQSSTLKCSGEVNVNVDKYDHVISVDNKGKHVNIILPSAVSMKGREIKVAKKCVLDGNCCSVKITTADSSKIRDLNSVPLLTAGTFVSDGEEWLAWF